jgi:hypothetical protein
MKITLPSVAGGYNLQQINANFQTLANELNTRVWYRNNVGSEPNTPAQDIDMNGKRQYNLPFPTSDSEPITRGYADLYLSGEVTSELVDLAAEVAAEAILVDELATTATTQAGICITQANLAITAAGEAAVAQGAAEDAVAAITLPIPVASGGTGTTSASAARAALGAAAIETGTAYPVGGLMMATYYNNTGALATISIPYGTTTDSANLSPGGIQSNGSTLIPNLAVVSGFLAGGQTWRCLGKAEFQDGVKVTTTLWQRTA